MAAPKITAEIAADVLGINRTRDGDLRPMVRALGLAPVLNSPEEARRHDVAKWALRNWDRYQAECQRRRERPSEPATPLAKATRALVAQVNALLDYKGDKDMEAASDAATDALAGIGELEETARELLKEADAHLDYVDDEDMQEAADALRDLLPEPASAPGP